MSKLPPPPPPPPDAICFNFIVAVVAQAGFSLLFLLAGANFELLEPILGCRSGILVARRAMGYIWDILVRWEKQLWPYGTSQVGVGRR